MQVIYQVSTADTSSKASMLSQHTLGDAVTNDQCLTKTPALEHMHQITNAKQNLLRTSGIVHVHPEVTYNTFVTWELLLHT